MRGISFSCSKKPKGIEYDRYERKRGSSKLGLYNTFTYAINALIEETPIFIRYFGRFALFLSFSTFVFTILNMLNSFSYLSLFNNILIIICSVVSVFLSIIGEYILRIYLHLKKTKKINYEKTLNINLDE